MEAKWLIGFGIGFQCGDPGSNPTLATSWLSVHTLHATDEIGYLVIRPLEDVLIGMFAKSSLFTSYYFNVELSGRSRERQRTLHEGAGTVPANRCI